MTSKKMLKIESGEMRKKYGLDTSTGSMYHSLVKAGKSDTEAQYEVFKRRKLV